MPISTKCLITQANACLAGTPTELNLTQISGVKSSNTVYSVANTSVLPAASCNKGRMIFVEDISAYRYSDGFEWTNCYDSTCRISRSELYGFGFNGCGAIGNNSTVAPLTPTQEISSSINWCYASAGYKHSLAIKSNNELWAMGGNGYYAVCPGSTISHVSSPIREFLSGSWCVASAGFQASSGIKTDGTLWSWGRGNSGGLGNNTGESQSSSPVQEITSSTNWASVCSCSVVSARKSNGELWAWGANGSGQLGNNSVTPASSPVREASSSTDWCASSNSSDHSGAIKTDGTLWMWGYNGYGKLALNSCVSYSSPVQEISSSINWCSIALGSNHATSIKSDGTLWGWGRNNCGQLGTGNVICRSSPVQEITSSTNWLISTDNGNIHTNAIKTDGSLWSWGINQGQIGDNTGTARSSPVREFLSLNSWCFVSGGQCHTLAITSTTKGFNEP